MEWGQSKNIAIALLRDAPYTGLPVKTLTFSGKFSKLLLKKFCNCKL